MYKKIMRIASVLCSFIFLTGCGSSSGIKGNEIIEQDILDSVTSVISYNPDESRTIVDDPEKVSEICNIIASGIYVVEENKELEGGVWLELDCGDYKIEVGLGRKYFRYNGVQYTVVNDIELDEILEIMGIR